MRAHFLFLYYPLHKFHIKSNVFNTIRHFFVKFIFLLIRCYLGRWLGQVKSLLSSWSKDARVSLIFYSIRFNSQHIYDSDILTIVFISHSFAIIINSAECDFFAFIAAAVNKHTRIQKIMFVNIKPNTIVKSTPSSSLCDFFFVNA